MQSKNGKRWGGAEIKYLIKYSGVMTSEEIAGHLGRTADAVRSMMKCLRQGKEIPEDDNIYPLGMYLSQEEKESRIYKMAAQMRIRLDG